MLSVLRQSSIPALYYKLQWIRQSPPVYFADLPEDMDRIQALAAVANGSQCVSLLEGPNQLIIKANLPSGLGDLTGETEYAIDWSYYYWKAWDIENLAGRMPAAEAVSLASAGIDAEILWSLLTPESCIPWLKKVADLYDFGNYKGFELKQETSTEIQQQEKRLFAQLEIDRIKSSFTKSRKNTPQKKNSGLTPTRRDEILRRDSYKCIFCGQSSEDATLEVNHVIPRSIIDKLNLGEDLLTDSANLCATCFDCNRGKSDRLYAEDIDFYLARFSEHGHPNNPIVPLLKRIKDLQKGKGI